MLHPHLQIYMFFFIKFYYGYTTHSSLPLTLILILLPQKGSSRWGRRRLLLPHQPPHVWASPLLEHALVQLHIITWIELVPLLENKLVFAIVAVIAAHVSKHLFKVLV